MSRTKDYWAFCAVGGHTVPRAETTSRIVGSISFLVCQQCNKGGTVNAKAEKPLAKEITTGEKYFPAMAITTQDDADAYFEKLVEHTMSHGRLRPEAEQLERRNLGYFAGYYGPDTRERVERLFKTEHPIFGSIAKNGPPDPAEVLARGILAGQEGQF